MQVRLVVGHVEPRVLDEVLDRYQALILTHLGHAPGFLGAQFLGERARGKIVLILRWQSAAALEAAESLHQAVLRGMRSWQLGCPLEHHYDVLREIISPAPPTSRHAAKS